MPERSVSIERGGRTWRISEVAWEEAEDEERTWREQARVIFLLVTDTGIRRAEALGLRWRAVQLAGMPTACCNTPANRSWVSMRSIL